MSLSGYLQQVLPAIEQEMQQVVRLAGRAAADGNPETGNPPIGEYTDELRHMLAYHLGWEGEGAGSEARGKRVRPLLVLLAASAAGGDWQAALPAAAAVELVHNFSLIHDDIEDKSVLRRGRPTVWSRWGIAQAINAGDTLFTLAHLAMLRLAPAIPPATVLYASQILHDTCLRLTQGQYLDIAYENRPDITLDDYWPMISGKTATLLATCPELGARIAGAASPTCQAYQAYGYALGLAFQAQDDLLGIWGEVEKTGKSAESDLVSGKKTLPVLFGLARQGGFARRWAQGPITAEEAPEIAKLLASEGAKDYTLEETSHWTKKALQALEQAQPQGEAGEALFELTHRLVNRQA